MNGKWRDRLPERLRGQSEVLGVALLTAVVVILVATVALFLFTDFTQEANDEELLADVTTDVTSENITIVHQGGDSFNPSNVSVILRGDTSAEFKLSDFENKPDDPSSFSPGDTWVNTDESLAGEFRILVVNEPTNTVLHDQQHEVKIQDVRIRINDEPPNDDGKFVKGPIDMPGANPDGVGNEDIISREYQIEVRYSTGEGWKKQTGGTDNLQFDSSGSSNPLSVDKKDKTGGVILASKPPSQKTTVDVSVNTNTSSDAVDEEVTSNTVTVNVFDADIDTKTTIDGITPDPGDTEGTNNATVNWRVENKGDRKFDPSVTVTFTVRDRNDNVIPATADASGFSNVEDCTQLGSGSVECDVEFQGGLLGPKELASDNGTLPQINVNVDSYTTELSVKAETTPSIIGTDDSLTKSNGINPANFEVPELTTSFDNSNQDVILKWTVKNSGSWTDRQSVSVTTDPNTGDSSSPLDNEGVTIKPGNSVDESGFSGAGGYSIQNGKTSRVKVTVTTLNSSRDTVAKSWDPANFDVTDVSAQVVRVGGSDQVRVEYNVTNTGDLTYQEQVSLAVRKGSGNKESTGVSKTLSLDPGETVSDSLTTDSRDDFSTGQNTFIVESEDTSGKDKLTIDPPSFDVTIDEAKYRFSGGTDEVAVNYSVNNTGDLTGKNDLKTIFRFYNGSTKIDTKTRSKTGVLLKGDEVKTRNVSASIDNTVDTDKVEVDVYSNGTDTGTVNDTESRTVTFTPGNLDLAITNFEANPNGNGKLVVNYTLTNTGDLERVTDVSLNTTYDNGTRIRTVDTTTSEKQLRGGESKTLALSGEMEPGDFSNGNVDFRVNATDDAQASSEATDSVDAEPANLEFKRIGPDAVIWDTTGDTLRIDNFRVENTGDVPSEPQSVVEFSTVLLSASNQNGNSINVGGSGPLATTLRNTFTTTVSSTTVSSLAPGKGTTGAFTAPSDTISVRDSLGPTILSQVSKLKIRGNLSTDDDYDRQQWQVNPPSYDPRFDNVDFPQDDNSPKVTVDWKVKNTGDFSQGPVDITLYVNGDVVTTEPQRIGGDTEYDPSPNTSGRLTDPVYLDKDNDGIDEPVINVTLVTDDGKVVQKATKLKTVNPHRFELNSVNFEFEKAANETDSAQVKLSTYDLKNKGQFPGEQRVEFLVNGVVKDSTTVSLNPKQSDDSYTFSANVSESDFNNNNKINLEVRTENDSSPGKVQAPPAKFTINSPTFSFAPATASKDATVTVDYGGQITNTGNFTDTQNIELLVDGSPVTSRPTTLAPGETVSPTETFSTPVTESAVNTNNNEIPVELRTDDTSKSKDLSAKPSNLKINTDSPDKPKLNFVPASSNGPPSVIVQSYKVKNTGDFDASGEARLFAGGSSTADTTGTITGPIVPGESVQLGGLSTPVSESDLNSNDKIPIRLEVSSNGDSTDFDSKWTGKTNALEQGNLTFVDSGSSVSFTQGDLSGSYKITNDGDFNASGTVKLEAKWDGTARKAGTPNNIDTGKLVPGGTDTGAFGSRTAPVPGIDAGNTKEYTVQMVADGARYKKTYPSAEAPQFEVSNVAASYDGTALNVDYDLTNEGDFVGKPAYAKINANKPSGDSFSEQFSGPASSSFDPGETRRLSNSVTKSISPDSDPGNVVVLTNFDGNNNRNFGNDNYAEYTVSPATFDVTSMSAIYDAPDEQAVVDFTVENVGSVSATKTVTVSTDPDGHGGEKDVSVSVGPGSSTSKTGKTVSITEHGATDIVVSVDGNSSREQITVAPADYTVVPSGTSAGGSYGEELGTSETLDVDYEIRNDGGISNPDTQVKLKIDGSTEGTDTVAPAPGADNTVTGTFSYSPDRANINSPTFNAEVTTINDSYTVLSGEEIYAPPKLESISVNRSTDVWLCGGTFQFNCNGVQTVKNRLDATISYQLSDPGNDFEQLEAEYEQIAGKLDSSTWGVTTRSSSDPSNPIQLSKTKGDYTGIFDVLPNLNNISPPPTFDVDFTVKADDGGSTVTSSQANTYDTRILNDEDDDPQRVAGTEVGGDLTSFSATVEDVSVISDHSDCDRGTFDFSNDCHLNVKVDASATVSDLSPNVSSIELVVSKSPDADDSSGSPFQGSASKLVSPDRGDSRSFSDTFTVEVKDVFGGVDTFDEGTQIDIGAKVLDGSEFLALKDKVSGGSGNYESGGQSDEAQGIGRVDVIESKFIGND